MPMFTQVPWEIWFAVLLCTLLITFNSNCSFVLSTTLVFSLCRCLRKINKALLLCTRLKESVWMSCGWKHIAQRLTVHKMGNIFSVVSSRTEQHYCQKLENEQFLLWSSCYEKVTVCVFYLILLPFTIFNIWPFLNVNYFIYFLCICSQTKSSQSKISTWRTKIRSVMRSMCSLVFNSNLRWSKMEKNKCFL